MVIWCLTSTSTMHGRWRRWPSQAWRELVIAGWVNEGSCYYSLYTFEVSCDKKVLTTCFWPKEVVKTPRYCEKAFRIEPLLAGTLSVLIAKPEEHLTNSHCPAPFHMPPSSWLIPINLEDPVEMSLPLGCLHWLPWFRWSALSWVPPR